MNEPSNTMIFKICPAKEWRDAQMSGSFRGSAVDVADGFIHFSAAHQVQETAAKHFRGQSDLMLIGVSAGCLGDGLKWEASRGGDLFPHLYGELRTDLAAYEVLLDINDDGVPIIPEQVVAC